MCSLACRRSSCGTSCQQTTWTRTLWSAAGSGWRTFCSVWRRTQSSPMTRSSTTSSLRYMLQLWWCVQQFNLSFVDQWLTEITFFTLVCGRNTAGRKWCMRQDFRQRYWTYVELLSLYSDKVFRCSQRLTTSCYSCSGRLQAESSQCYLQGEKSR